MHSSITEYQPGNALSKFVDCYWEGSFQLNTSKSVSMQMIPNGCVELIIHLNDLHCDLYSDVQWSQSPDYMILGLFTRPYEVRLSGTVILFAIRFKPEGIYSIFGIPASKFIDGYEDMAMVIGDDFRGFCHRVREEKSTTGMVSRTESYLLRTLQRNKIDLSYINFAAELIRQIKGIRIEELSDRVFISQRQLEREFKNKLGIGPKHYLRIMRLNEVQRLLKDRAMDLTSVAYHCGYTDQAHFIRDFKSIIGENPTIFLKGKNRYIVNPGVKKYV